jgi:hypothetical protein
MTASRAFDEIRRGSAAVAGSGVLAFVLLGLAGWTRGSTAAPPADDPTGGVPLVERDEGYAGAESCAGCHPRNHASWHASYHRTMTQVATPATMLAPWVGTTPPFEGRVWKLERSDDVSFATAVRLTGEVEGPTRRVVQTTGSHHYQIYWLEPAEGEGMFPLPLVWHVGERTWAPRKAMFLTPPQPWTVTEAGRWGQSCIRCHATNGTPRAAHAERVPGADERVQVAELGIACEACHGPGAAHVAWHADEDAAKARGEAEPELVDPSALDHVRASQVCGQCHGFRPFPTPEARAAWEREGSPYRPGQDLDAIHPLLRGRVAENPPALKPFAERNPTSLSQSFWSDGEVRVSGREYGGLAESACFQRGELSCLSCHELHPDTADARELARWASDQLKPGRDTSAACLACHESYADAEKRAAHTHHAPGSSGDDCLNCHMPFTTSGLTKAIRSHTIRSPRAATAVATGRPDACSLCHLDKPLAWTAEKLASWYGHEVPALGETQKSTAASVVWALEGDAGQRALIASAYAWEPARAVSGTGWMPYVLSTLLMDTYDAVRWIAGRAVRMDPRWRDFRLDSTLEYVPQTNPVRDVVLTQWLKEGLVARPDQRAAVLVTEEGKLDEARFRAMYARRDHREVRLQE